MVLTLVNDSCFLLNWKQIRSLFKLFLAFWLINAKAHKRNSVITINSYLLVIGLVISSSSFDHHSLVGRYGKCRPQRQVLSAQNGWCEESKTLQHICVAFFLKLIVTYYLSKIDWHEHNNPPTDELNINMLLIVTFPWQCNAMTFS